MSITKSCLTCGFYVSKNCSKGTEAKKFCLGNSEFELWKPISEETLAERKKEMEQAQEKVVLEELQEESLDNTVAVANPEETEEDIQNAKQQLMALGMDEAQAEQIARSTQIEKQKVEDEKTFDGFNGIKKPQQVTIISDTCEGCRNDSTLVGCFLNKFSECVASGRYLYQHEDGLAGTSAGLEGQEDEALKDKIKKTISLEDILDDVE